MNLNRFDKKMQRLLAVAKFLDLPFMGCALENPAIVRYSLVVWLSECRYIHYNIYHELPVSDRLKTKGTVMYYPY